MAAAFVYDDDFMLGDWSENPHLMRNYKRGAPGRLYESAGGSSLFFVIFLCVYNLA